VAQYCDDVAVMFAGSVMECGPVRQVFSRPTHPYTRALLAATPERLRLGSGAVFGGAPPDLYALPEGCVYRDRCVRADAACARPVPWHGDPAQGARCHHIDAGIST